MFKRWFYVALVELLPCRKAGVSVPELASKLHPNPGEEAVQQALQDLLDWGFVKRSNGRYLRSEPTLTTGDDIQSLAVANFQRMFPGLELVIVESGGDNLTAVFSRELADRFIFVIDGTLVREG